MRRTNHTKTGRPAYPPGESISPEHTSWRGMKQRCHNQKDPRYDLYGGRGILVCDKWRDDYLAFLADMGRKPSPRHSLDRIDNDKGYEPGNCRWADYNEQSRNRRTNRTVTVDGITKTVTEWESETGVHYQTILRRLKEGWEPKKAVTLPPTINHRYLTVDGETKALTEWAREYKIDYTTIISRLKMGWSEDSSVKTPALVSDIIELPKFTLSIPGNLVRQLLAGAIPTFGYTDTSGCEWSLTVAESGNLVMSKRL